MKIILAICLTLMLLSGSQTRKVTAPDEECRTFPTSSAGTCILFKDCPQLKALLEKTSGTDQDEVIQILRGSVCATNPIRVCCATNTASTMSPSSGLPGNCGTGKLADFIVGGENAKSWWPWMVSLRGKSVSDGTQHHFCGGTLIHKRFVLTAAHCNDPSIILESVRLGELIIGPDPDTIQGGITAPTVQNIRVEHVYTHPNYTIGCSRCNDISILKLAHPVDIRPGFVSPICLPLQLEKDIGATIKNLAGNYATLAGWGSDSRNPWNPTKPDHLQEVQLKIDSTDFCERVTARNPAGSVLCAGSGDGKDACRGDSGGPLMIQDDLGSRFYLLGISSFGPTVCGSQDTQGIFTNINYYIRWIQLYIDNAA